MDQVQYLAMSSRELPDEVLAECQGVVSTAGIMIDSSWPAPMAEAYRAAKPWAYQSTSAQEGTYAELNRDLHVDLANRLAHVAAASRPAFVYISCHAPNELNRNLPLVSEYFATKQQAEEELMRIEALRSIILRPTVMYDDDHPHSLPAASFSRFGDMVDSALNRAFALPKGSMPHFIPGPPVFVDTVAECAVEAVLDPSAEGLFHLTDIKHLADQAGGASMMADQRDAAA